MLTIFIICSSGLSLYFILKPPPPIKQPTILSLSSTATDKRYDSISIETAQHNAAAANE
ncbi:hypothetical protein ABEW34_11115 [Paenibacillus algorifonticola]|uniref:hypothetical protein n=1 Tax=Paenibacillus algorifonticola TaxID=684063 RepID=UPI003D276B84